MKKNVGLWIDHASAVIVTVTGEKGEDFEIMKIVSDTENHPHSKVVADDTRQSVLTEYLNRYYDEVISAIGSAESIFIFGPGEAKGELENRLKSHRHSEKTINLETSDSLTEPQVAAKVRAHFQI